MNDIQYRANALGFRGVYLLKPAPYPHFAKRRDEGTLHENSAHVSDDPTRDYPWSNAILLLLYPYKPYPETYYVSGYYPASNRCYHAVNDLIRYLSDRHIRAERVSLPVRETLLRHDIGIACKNGLTAVMPLGTRFVVQMLALSVPQEILLHRIDTETDHYRVCSVKCDRCQSVCPSHAITEDGMRYTECIRADMNGGCMQQKTMITMTNLLGCERCQFVCPLNSKIEIEKELPQAFELDRILRGEVKPAYELIGKNMRSGGRLEQHALIMAANLGRKDLLPLIDTYLSDSRPQIVQAAEYAISILHKTKE